MGFFSRFFRADGGGPPSPIDDYWYTPLGTSSAAGVRVNGGLAYKTSAVLSAVRVISETVGSLPALTYHYLPDGSKERATDYPLYPILHDRPNAWQTPMDFKSMMTGHAVLRGNAYAVISPDPDPAFLFALVPRHPDRMEVKSNPDGSYFYRYQSENGQYINYSPDEIFHLRGFSDDGMRGLSLLDCATDSIGLALAQERYAAAFFKQGAQPLGALKMPGRLDEDQIERLRRSWQAKHGGISGSHGIAILENGLEWQSIGISQKDSQFLESRQFTINDIARWFRVPPHMIGDLMRATFSNIEQQGMDFLQFCLLPWLVRWEQTIQRDLILESPGEFFTEFLVDNLLRGDTKTRYEAYMIGRQGGWLSPNDVLRMENRNPRLDGDTYNETLPGTQAGTVTLNSGPPAAPPADAPSDQDQASRMAEQFARDAAARVVRKERAALKREAFGPFYAKHAAFVVESLHIDERAARDYCAERALAEMDGEPSDEWAIGYLVDLMLGRVA